MGKTVTVKHDAVYNEAMDKAEEGFRRPDGVSMVDKCPYAFSSNLADAYWITAHVLYCTGRRPRALHKSQGHSWTVDFPGLGIVTARVNRADHREGVVIG